MNLLIGGEPLELTPESGPGHDRTYTGTLGTLLLRVTEVVRGDLRSFRVTAGRGLRSAGFFPGTTATARGRDAQHAVDAALAQLLPTQEA